MTEKLLDKAFLLLAVFAALYLLAQILRTLRP